MKSIAIIIWWSLVGLLFIILSTVTCYLSPVYAALPVNFQATPTITVGLDTPTRFDFAPDGRIFILQRTGEVLIYKNGQLLPEPFTVLLSANTGDRGLIGITFDPNFFINHYVYFYYSSSDDFYNRLVRFDASLDYAQNGPVILWTSQEPNQMLHQGGGLEFGPDGKIYLGVGDNGVSLNAQDLSSERGKVLRLNPNGTVPTDNPFYGQPGKDWAIWAYGFRNPWKLQFDYQTGRLYLSDVGEAGWEEINLITKGGNYGWSISEGNCTQNCSNQINPVYTYSHNGGSAAATGGPVYRGSMFPEPYLGSYFFGDYALGFINYMTLDDNGYSTGVNTFNSEAGNVVDLKVASDGSLYYLTLYPAGFFQVIYTTGNKLPVAKASSSVTQGVTPLEVNFSSSGTSDPDGDNLTYLWDFGDGTTSTETNPTKTYTNKGQYTVQLKVSDGTYTVLANPIIIRAGASPNLTIALPINGGKYNAGDTINFSASAIDNNGTSLPDSAFTTNIFYHHQTHIHPFQGPLIGARTGTLTIPTAGESSAQTFFEINVTATDSYGLTSSLSVNVYPNTVNFTLDTSPIGLQLSLDGIPTATPETILSVVNFQRELRAIYWQEFNSLYYQLISWSDGATTAARYYTIPASDSTLSASYNVMPSFTGQYFTNTSFAGAPAMTRQDPIINFNWDISSPDNSIPLNNYSVRWISKPYFLAGRYVFTTTSDDGVRLYVDNNLIIDKWFDQGTTSYSTALDLILGEHEIKMEYYQAYGGAVAKLNWDLTPNQPNLNPSPTPSASPTPTPTPSQTPTPTPLPTLEPKELLTVPWYFTAINGTSENYQPINPLILQGQDTLRLTYNLHGICLLGGDASAIIFDQAGEWHYISLSNYGNNCQNGLQTIDIPLSAFPGLNLSAPVGTFHARLWNSIPYTIDITSAQVLIASSPSPTSSPTPGTGSQLLTSPWAIRSTTGGAAEVTQTISSSALIGNTNLAFTYDLHGTCLLGGDASAIIFDQPNGSWHYVSLLNYGQNCYDGTQTVNILLSDFPGLNLSSSVGNFHARFWYPTSFAIDITSAIVSNSTNPTPTPSPTSSPIPTPQPTPGAGSTELLTGPWNLSGNNGDSNKYQSIDPNVLNGKSSLTLIYNLHGLCAVTGDASAIIFDQPINSSWHYISLSNYGQNCLDGTQTVTIPLSDFSGLNTSQVVGTFHTRFWYPAAFTVDIISAIVQ